MATRYSQPQSGARIDWANPINRGQAFAINSGAGPVNSVSGALVSSSSSLTKIVCRQGTAYSWDRTVPNPINTGVANANIVSHSGVFLVRHPSLSGVNAEQYIGNGVTSNNGFSFSTNTASGSVPNQTFVLSYTHGGVAQYNSAVAIAGANTNFIVIGFTATVSGTVRFFANGKFIDAVAIGSITQSSDTLRIGQHVFFANSPANYDLPYADYWNRGLSDAEQANIAQNVWKIFAPTNRQLLRVAVGNPALTGVAAAAALGTTLPQISIPLAGVALAAARGSVTPASAAPLTGQAAIAARGSVAPSITIPLTGQATTVGQGTVTVATVNITLPLTGQATAVAQGSVLPVLSVPLTGQSVVSGQGTLTPQTALVLTGQAVALAQGSVLPQTSVALLGQGVSVGQGTMVAPGNITVALTGQATSVAQGSLLAQISAPLTGQAVALAQGAVLPSGSATLTGQAVVAGIGSVAPQTMVALSGQSVVVGIGTMVVPGNVTVALTGVGVVAGIGTMTGSVTPDPGNGKSGVSRMWLIEYYTREFAKKAPTVVIPDGVTVAAKRKAVKKAAVVREAQIEALATKAEADLEVLAQGVKDIRAAQQFTYNLIQQAQRQPEPGVDFMQIADQYRKRIQRDDDELLLLSMVI